MPFLFILTNRHDIQTYQRGGRARHETTQECLQRHRHRQEWNDLCQGNESLVRQGWTPRYI